VSYSGSATRRYIRAISTVYQGVNAWEEEITRVGNYSEEAEKLVCVFAPVDDYEDGTPGEIPSDNRSYVHPSEPTTVSTIL